MRESALIFGAGAIGRGYLAPLLHKHGLKVSFVDTDKSLVGELRSRDGYTTAVAGKDGYEFLEVKVHDAFLFGDRLDIEKYSVVFSCVGPNKCYDLAEEFRQANAVISCENDIATVEGLKKLSGNPKIYFGIPDVITSHTAPPELLDRDSLMVVTERGELITEKGEYDLPDEIAQVCADELHMHWMCKLFVHNTPHAVVAYLGWLKKFTYIHEAMADQAIGDIVTGAMEEVTTGVISAGYAKKAIANAYKAKELMRFRNTLLFDEIVRVAREPIRKIGPNDRLVLALRIALFCGIKPLNLAYGFRAALEYSNPTDEESVYLQNLRKVTSTGELLQRFGGISSLDPLSDYLARVSLPPYFLE